MRSFWRDNSPCFARAAPSGVRRLSPPPARLFRSAVVMILPLALACAWASAQERSPGHSLANGLEKLQTIAETIQRAGPWEDQMWWVDRSIERVWEKNRWNEESDRFALQTTREVAKIPPWQFMQRFDHFTQAVGDRYSLSEEQRARLKGLMLREVAGMALKHAPLIARQVQEQLELKLEAPDEAGRMRFIRENVARWMRESEPVYHDFFEVAERMSASFGEMLNADQKQIYQRDLKTFERLLKYNEHLRNESLAGRFEPEDWGLQRDEFLQVMDQWRIATERGREEAAGQERAEPPPRWTKHEPTTWYTYVR